ncbi:MAG: hypothetical protein H0U70_02345 [Tatlockia sp.]|nr:hypothetical protein [Tatlockia sp.]
MAKILDSYRINYQDFDRRLLEETNLLENWFIDKIFIERELEIGSEIECFLLDKDYNPAPDNLRLIKLVNKPYLIAEVGSAQLEINSEHFNFSSDCLSRLHANILQSWRYCCEIANQNDYHLTLIGSLPTATEMHHQKKFMTKVERYLTLDSCMAEHRAGKPIKINIDGYESLHIEPESLAMNGVVSAFQMHMQIGLSQSVRYYNVAQAIAGPVLALSANSPFIFGRHIWSDSRIVTFDQANTVSHFDTDRGFKCCCFGLNYLKDSFYELYEQNYQFYPRLMPQVDLELPLEKMFHVKRQNGIVYRWNRPVIDFNSLNQPHLRIEHRGPSSGPTVIDMIANAAFFYGLLNYFAVQDTPIEYLLPFHFARKNFYKAAKKGMDTQFNWFLGEEIMAYDLLEKLIPLARKGLQIFGINPADITLYLDVIERRVSLKTNGSDWQCRFIKKNGKDFNQMMAIYVQNQTREIPVSEWKI